MAEQEGPGRERRTKAPSLHMRVKNAPLQSKKRREKKAEAKLSTAHFTISWKPREKGKKPRGGSNKHHKGQSIVLAKPKEHCNGSTTIEIRRWNGGGSRGSWLLLGQS